MGRVSLYLMNQRSVLTPVEVDAFLQMLDRLRKDQFAVLLITHKINEVMAIADRVTVLRHGTVNFTASKEMGYTGDQLVANMMGTKPLMELDQRSPFTVPAMQSHHALEAKKITIQDDHGQMILEEHGYCDQPKVKIVGIAGISGNGQKELMEALFGLRALTQARFLLMGSI